MRCSSEYMAMLDDSPLCLKLSKSLRGHAMPILCDVRTAPAAACRNSCLECTVTGCKWGKGVFPEDQNAHFWRATYRNLIPQIIPANDRACCYSELFAFLSSNGLNILCTKEILRRERVERQPKCWKTMFATEGHPTVVVLRHSAQGNDVVNLFSNQKQKSSTMISSDSA